MTSRGDDLDVAYDDAASLAQIICGRERPLLLCTDVDGTLSPIAPTPADARLADGARAALVALHAAGIVIAVVSGRTLAELVRQFELPTTLSLIGSHGGEFERPSPRTARETDLLARVDVLLTDIAADHEGATLERKPLSAALHVRQCVPDVGVHALESVRAAMSPLVDVQVAYGHCVAEVMVRMTSKVTAVAELCRRSQPRSLAFIGDDQSDEHVFVAMQHHRSRPLGATSVTDAIGVKVGSAASVATHRLRSPHTVVAMLTHLARSSAS